ncbi:hypothetical protein MmiEs2_11600 [Methanimicrococcus stummii]|uniref:Toprim domain-containing protein n=1 Tax=Methanimicrococcus stummii TaxID=3028294 RepID=A0AA96V900_9EURY|nr:toprim domain-containing protein [Methanimicrococcus sp. Es2]WNY28947.1 hypothetical protein MmiEs2_11600 [Methanimicrococcus sp. Es2]
MQSQTTKNRDIIALEAIETVLEELKGGDGSTEIEKIDEISAGSFIIIVEGRRDVASLRNLGITAEIFPCANQPVAEFCEKIAEMKKTAIILTDWDRKGAILASRLEIQLKNLDVAVDTSQREKLLFYSKREIKDIESLYNHVLKLRKNVNGEEDLKEDFEENLGRNFEEGFEDIFEKDSENEI